MTKQALREAIVKAIASKGEDLPPNTGLSDTSIDTQRMADQILSSVDLYVEELIENIKIDHNYELGSARETLFIRNALESSWVLVKAQLLTQLRAKNKGEV